MEKPCLLHLLFFLLITINGVNTTYVCGDEYFPPNTTYSQSLTSLVPLLADQVISQQGFSNTSLNGVYTSALCRKHYEAQSCRSCVDRISRNLLNQCQGKAEAYCWNSEDVENVACFVRYSINPTFGNLKLEPFDNVLHSSVPTTLNITRISHEFSVMANRTVEIASKADESSVLKYYGVSRGEFTDVPEISMMMQCTPDLSEIDCSYCLEENVRYNREQNRGRKGGTISRPSCYFRWDDYSFSGAFDSIEKLSAPPRPDNPREAEDSLAKKGTSIDYLFV